MEKIGLVPGDLVELKGKNVLVVKVLRALGGDNSIGKIRLDGNVRSNIGVSIEEEVEIKKVVVKEAKHVTLAPLQEIRLSKESSGYLHSKFLDLPLTTKQKLTILASGNKLKYIVSKTEPKGSVVVTPLTEFILSEEVYSGESETPGIYYEDIGGLKDEIELVREMVELPMKQPEIFEKLGIVAQLLTLMDGLKSRGQIVVMAATNRPDDIDPALRRPGRFDRELRINPPAEDARKEILQIHTRGMPLGDDVNFDELANKTIGYVGADLEVLCKEAALKALKPNLKKFKNLDEKLPAEELDKIKVYRNDFIEALKQIEPSAMREVLIKKPNVHWTDVGGLKEAK